MAFLNKLLSYSSQDLINAINAEDKNRFATILKSGLLPDKPNQSSLTPLFFTVYKNLPHFAFELLERKANADAVLEGAFVRGKKLLQICINLPNSSSMAALLVLYGASLEGLTFSSSEKKREILNFLERKRKVYETTSTLLTQPSPSSTENYQILGVIWLEEAKEESHEQLRQCYLRKANDCFAQANELKASSSSQHSTREVEVEELSPRQNAEEELPLISPSSSFTLIKRK